MLGPQRAHAMPLSNAKGPHKAGLPTACRVWPFGSKKNTPSDRDRVIPDEFLEQYAELQRQQQGTTPQQMPQNTYSAPAPPQQQQDDPEVLRTNSKWGWLDNETGAVPPQPQGMQRLQQPSPPPQTPQRQQQQRQQQQQQLSAQQQAALRDMVMDATVNPKWRWPSFGGSDSSNNTQQPPQQTGAPPPPPPPTMSWPPFMPPPGQQPQQPGRRGALGKRSASSTVAPPPPPPPPPPGAYYQQGFTDAQQSGQGGRWQQRQQEQEKRRKGWLWPLSGDGLSEEDEEYRAQLEAMGVDLVGSRAKEQQQQRQKGGKGGDDVDYEQMDDRQIAAYMNKMRQSRLERAAYKQDDEIVGIVGLYLGATMVILALAVLANLPP